MQFTMATKALSMINQSKEKLPDNTRRQRARRDSRQSQLKVVSLFAGAGGLDIAACMTGHVGDLVSTDRNDIFLQTIIKNVPKHFPDVNHHHFVEDARSVTGDMIWSALGAKEIDLVMGGPPCDDFTTYGRKQGAQGKKAPLIMEYARLIAQLQPKAFVFENVPNLARQFQAFFETFRSALPDNYNSVKWGILSAKQFGAPTLRERLFVVGFSDNNMARRFAFPTPTHGDKHSEPQLFDQAAALGPLATVEDALANLPDATAYSAKEYLNHVSRIHRPSTVEHMKTVPQGTAVTKSYRYRAPWRGQCRSLTAGLDDSAKAYIHPIYHREMTVREYARIHGFPDTWEFAGRLDNGLKQVANAVPIPLGRAVVGKVVDSMIGAPSN